MNGVPEPYFKVKARRYRLRLVNASNFTAYRLRLTNGKELTQIGTGQGLLPTPVRRGAIFLGPSQRAEVIVNFRGLPGERVVLESVPRPQSEPRTGTKAADVLQFRVGDRARDGSQVPDRLRPLPKWVAKAPLLPSKVWDFGLGVDENTGGTAWTINGRTFDHDRVDAEVPKGSVQTWQFVNTSNTTHWVHQHGVPFVVLSRNGEAPPAWEAGLEDTIPADPGENVVVASKFSDYTGRYVLHCHMIEHGDHGMMAHFKVTES